MKNGKAIKENSMEISLQIKKQNHHMMDQQKWPQKLPRCQGKTACWGWEGGSYQSGRLIPQPLCQLLWKMQGLLTQQHKKRSHHSSRMPQIISSGCKRITKIKSYFMHMQSHIPQGHAFLCVTCSWLCMVFLHYQNSQSG